MKTCLSVGMSGVCLALTALAGPAVNAQDKPKRLNTLLTLLEEQRDRPIISSQAYTFYDMEHPPFDVAGLRAALESGKFPTDKPVVVRITAYGWEIDKNQWQVKQVLDAGAHGVVFPRIDTPEQAVTAIRAMRYPQRPGAPDFEPAGRRGWLPTMAARYWGLDPTTYVQRADVWRLDPAGELIPVLLIESREGVENVREIARTMKTLKVGVILWLGTGDMSIDYCGVADCEVDGKPTPEAALLERAVRTVLAAGKEFDLPVQMNSPVVRDPTSGRPVQQDMAAHIKQRMQQGARLFPTGG